MRKCLLTGWLVGCGMMLAAQSDSAWVLCFAKKGKAFETEQNPYYPGKKGFYLYENCIYNVILKGERQLNMRVIAIQKDSIVATTHFNRAVADKLHQLYDTLFIAPAAIQSLQLINDRAMGLFQPVPLHRYTFFFRKEASPRRLVIDTVAVYTNQPKQYELIPYLTSQGLDLLYEEGGKTWYFQGAMQKDTNTVVIKKRDTVFRNRNLGWLLPFNANRINGLALGIHTGSISGRPLTINGLNANADLLSAMAGMMAIYSIFSKVPLHSVADSSATDEYTTRINGLSVSMGGLLRCHTLRGVSVNGGICSAVRTHGIVITGLYNYIDYFRGISICGLRNVSYSGRGLQVGLFNVCRRLKGVQIGL